MNREANGRVEGSKKEGRKKRVTGPWSASNVSHTHVRIHKSIIARGCRRSTKEERKLPRSVPVPHWTRASPAEFFRISLPVPLSEPPTMARSAIREGFPLPYVHPISQHPSWTDNSGIVHASLRRVQVFAFQSARIARVLAKHVAAIIVCADAQFNALSINWRPSLVHITL